jgi:hypothetical protein
LVAVDTPDKPDKQARLAWVDFLVHLAAARKVVAALAAVAAAAKVADPWNPHCLAAKSIYCSETRRSASFDGMEGYRGRYAASVVEAAAVALVAVAEGYVVAAAAAAAGIRHSLVDFVSDTAVALVLGAADHRIVLAGTSADYRLGIRSRRWTVLAGSRC